MKNSTASNLGSNEFLCKLSLDLNISQYLTLKMHNSDIRYWILDSVCVSICDDRTFKFKAHDNTRYINIRDFCESHSQKYY
jgi:hypothetical protein